MFDVAIKIEKVTSEYKIPAMLTAIYEFGDITLNAQRNPARVLSGSGQIVLVGGESEAEAHNRLTETIKKIDPNAEVTTKWHYAEWFEWDQIFTT